jgi:hypothetical protein
MISKISKTIVKYKSRVLLFLVSIVFYSCQDVIDLPLDTEAPRLVVEANLLAIDGQSASNQTIKLTTTSDYYSETVPTASGASVSVIDTKNNVFVFTESANSGNYICDNFIAEIGENYTLKITYKNQNYEAKETFLETPDIEEVTQEKKNFFGQDLTEIKFFFQDNGFETNYYLVGVNSSSQLLPAIGALDDQFSQGNRMFGLYRDDKLKTDDELILGLQSVSERYFNYLSKLIEISGSEGGGPFSTPPATVKGNIVNLTNKNNYALGYFSLAEGKGENYKVK